MASTPQGWFSGGHEDRSAQINASYYPVITQFIHDHLTFSSDMCIGTTLQTNSL